MARPASLPAWLRTLTWMDTILLFLLFALVWYAGFNIFSLVLGAKWPFDIMLLTGGTAFLAVALPASHIGERTTRVLQNLDGSGAVTFDSETERRSVQDEMERIGRRYGWYGMSVLVAVVLVSLVGAQTAGGQPQVEILILGAVLATCAGYTGYRFGQFYANGNLFQILADRGHELRGGGSLVAEAIVPLRQLYSIAVIAGLFLCCFFNVWWAAWAFHLPVAENYVQWQYPFLGMAGVSVVALLVVGLVPVRRFTRRLAAIQGDPIMRQSMVKRQRDLVSADIRSIEDQLAPVQAQPTQRRIAASLEAKRAALEAYKAGLSNQVYGDWLMRPSTILLAAATSAALVALCVSITGIAMG